MTHQQLLICQTCQATISKLEYTEQNSPCKICSTQFPSYSFSGLNTSSQNQCPSTQICSKCATSLNLCQICLFNKRYEDIVKVSHRSPHFFHHQTIKSPPHSTLDSQKLSSSNPSISSSELLKTVNPAYMFQTPTQLKEETLSLMQKLCETPLRAARKPTTGVNKLRERLAQKRQVLSDTRTVEKRQLKKFVDQVHADALRQMPLEDELAKTQQYIIIRMLEEIEEKKQARIRRKETIQIDNPIQSFISRIERQKKEGVAIILEQRRMMELEDQAALELRNHPNTIYGEDHVTRWEEQSLLLSNLGTRWMHNIQKMEKRLHKHRLTMTLEDDLGHLHREQEFRRNHKHIVLDARNNMLLEDSRIQIIEKYMQPKPVPADVEKERYNLEKSRRSEERKINALILNEKMEMRAEDELARLISLEEQERKRIEAERELQMRLEEIRRKEEEIQRQLWLQKQRELAEAERKRREKEEEERKQREEMKRLQMEIEERERQEREEEERERAEREQARLEKLKEEEEERQLKEQHERELKEAKQAEEQRSQSDNLLKMREEDHKSLLLRATFNHESSDGEDADAGSAVSEESEAARAAKENRKKRRKTTKQQKSHSEQPKQEQKSETEEEEDTQTIPHSPHIPNQTAPSDGSENSENSQKQAPKSAKKQKRRKSIKLEPVKDGLSPANDELARLIADFKSAIRKGESLRELSNTFSREYEREEDLTKFPSLVDKEAVLLMFETATQQYNTLSDILPVLVFFLKHEGNVKALTPPELDNAIKLFHLPESQACFFPFIYDIVKSLSSSSSLRSKMLIGGVLDFMCLNVIRRVISYPKSTKAFVLWTEYFSSNPSQLIDDEKILMIEALCTLLVPVQPDSIKDLDVDWKKKAFLSMNVFLRKMHKDYFIKLKVLDRVLLFCKEYPLVDIKQTCLRTLLFQISQLTESQLGTLLDAQMSAQTLLAILRQEEMKYCVEAIVLLFIVMNCFNLNLPKDAHTRTVESAASVFLQPQSPEISFSQKNAMLAFLVSISARDTEVLVSQKSFMNELVSILSDVTEGFELERTVLVWNLLTLILYTTKTKKTLLETFPALNTLFSKPQFFLMLFNNKRVYQGFKDEVGEAMQALKPLHFVYRDLYTIRPEHTKLDPLLLKHSNILLFSQMCFQEAIITLEIQPEMPVFQSMFTTLQNTMSTLGTTHLPAYVTTAEADTDKVRFTFDLVFTRPYSPALNLLWTGLATALAIAASIQQVLARATSQFVNECKGKEQFVKVLGYTVDRLAELTPKTKDIEGMIKKLCLCCCRCFASMKFSKTFSSPLKQSLGTCSKRWPNDSDFKAI
ncbi:hypothetical protein BLNAU_8469 [Blattamonas nauphoetae]|uniref:STL11/RBM22-like N-terminal domain-containing protein n=1 Tax=Blattamonas nauphoetae TaxID=2049346 RepID=A0ABQ9XYT2_9EUKA|nr:hypothetical protein BLNAU_8469 [Blattamonas nauphoetae]